ncbi:MAG: hypothetical protein GEV07_00435 [Streptosporangiales bacterium]|nr:hypothetical protein [Streptosporangiales bacterium]
MSRAKELPSDVYVGAAVFVFAAVVFVASLQIREVSANVELIGPKVVPVALSVVIAAGAVALLVNGLRTAVLRARQPATEPAAGHDPDEEDEDAALPGLGRRFLVLAAMLLGYILIFIPVGYLIATFGFLLAVSTYIERRKWIRNAIFAAVFAGVVYVAFTYGLQVELPPGPIGLLA